MNRRCHLLFWCCLLLTGISLFPAGAVNQSVIELKYYNASDGLLTPSASEIIQTRNGLIWIGHHQGLSYYDGQHFRQFKSHPYDPIQLSDNHINHLKENSQGDLWCRTQDGNLYLFRMNGLTFDMLTPLKEMAGSLNIQEIHPLEKGVTWLSDAAGKVYRLNDRNPDIHPVSLPLPSEDCEIYHIFQWRDTEWLLSSKGPRIFQEAECRLTEPEGLENIPYCHYLTDADTLWLADSLNTLLEISPEGIESIPLPASGESIVSITFFGHREIVVCQEHSVHFYDRGRRQFHSEYFGEPFTIEEFHGDSKNNFWLIGQDGSIWRCEFGKSLRLHFDQPEIAPFFHRDLPSTLLFEDGQGQTWMVLKNGCLCYYDPDSCRLVQHFEQTEDTGLRFPPNIQTCFSDRQGNLWFGDRLSFGMMQFQPQAYEFVPTDLAVRTVLNDSKGRLWVSSMDWCVQIFDSESQRRIGYLSQDGQIQTGKCHFYDNIYCLMEDRKGRIWAGTRNSGLFVLKETESGHFSMVHHVHESGNPMSLSDNAVFDIQEDSRGHIWMATYQGGLNLVLEESGGTLSFANPKSGHWDQYPSEFLKTRCLFEDKGVMLIGGESGLLSFSNRFQHPEDIHFHQSGHQTGNHRSLSDNDVMYIFRPQKGDMYFLTLKGGINRFKGKNLLEDSLRIDDIYNEKNGLESDMALTMEEDSDGRLWIASGQCLSRFDPENGDFVHFKQDYFKGAPAFSQGNYGVLPDGRLMFGTSRGLLLVRPELLEPSHYVPPIHLNELRIENKVIPQDIDRNGRIVIHPDDNYFCVHFSALDYQNPRNIRYTYRLTDKQKKDTVLWHEWQEAGSAEFLKPNPGQYLLEIRSTNGDGVEVDNTRSVQIVVKPTFMQTWGAKTLMILTILFLSYLFGQIVFSYFKMRHRISFEKELSEVKLKFYTDISHELRTPLTLIESPVSEVLEHENLSETARSHLTLVKKNAERMLETVNQLLDFRKIQNRKMKMLIEETDLQQFTSGITEYFRQTAEEHRMDFRLETDDSHPYVWIDRDKVEKIIFNLLSNAFKYTEDGKSIRVNVGLEGGRPYVAVVDEGIGIATSQQERIFMDFETAVKHNEMPSSGIGLALVKELTDMHHAEIQLYSQYGRGSEFKVIFQTGRRHFEEDPEVEFILNDLQDGELLPQGERQPEEESRKDKEYSILVVEDNAELRMFTRDILAQCYRVYEAADGLDGLEKAREWMPDLILSDIVMPRMDGWKLVDELKKDGRISHIPIILLTANAGLEDRIDAVNKGVDDYLTKPFSASYLQAKIASLLKKRKLWQQHYLNTAIGTQIDSQLEQAPKIADYDERFLQKVSAYLEKNIDKSDLNIDAFASELSVSRSVFYTKIKNLLGLSPMDFIQQFRIRYACKLLEGTSLSLSEIAFRCGFNDPGYFGKRFRKQIGTTPSEYRNQIRKES